MANWSFFHQLKQDSTSSQHALTKREFTTRFQAVFSLMLVMLGMWLILHVLSSRGLFPFDRSNPDAPTLSAFSPSVQYWEDDIAAWSEDWSLDPYLIATVIQIESCGNPDVVSNVGAQGLFQVMPYHFNEDEDMKAVQVNAARGLSYLKEAFILSNGDIDRTLAGYNGGHAQIQRPAHLWPEETRRYVRWGSGIYHEAVSGASTLATLDTWLENGGRQLCQLAEQNLDLRYGD